MKAQHVIWLHFVPWNRRTLCLYRWSNDQDSILFGNIDLHSSMFSYPLVLEASDLDVLNRWTRHFKSKVNKAIVNERQLKISRNLWSLNQALEVLKS